MIIDPAIAERLRAAGHRVMSLPSLEPCSHCDTAEHLEITHLYVSGTYSISCTECGSEGQNMCTLRLAIERWNRAHFDNRQRKRRRAVGRQSEGMYP
jgi:hypothetical protein